MTRKSNKILYFAVAFIFARGVSVYADDSTLKGYSFCGTFDVSTVVSGNRLIVSDGSVLNLAMVKAPMIARQGQNFSPWPLAQWVKAEMEKILIGETLTLYCKGEEFDRFGERWANVYLSDGRWLQQEMLSKGWAFVDGLTAPSSAMDMLYQFEDIAQAKNLGVWGYESYKIRQADEPKSIMVGGFQTIRGQVQKIAITKKMTYVNFGATYQKDFTLEIAPKLTKQWTQEGFDFKALEGQTIDVRGWVDFKGGPRLVITHKNQIRLFTNP